MAHLTTVHHPQDPRIFHKQCKTLRDAGYRVHLVAQRHTSAIIDGIAVDALPQVHQRYARAGLQVSLFKRAYALRADVYHIHDPELIPLLWLLKHTTGAAVIYDMHEDYSARGGIEGAVLRGLEKWCFRWVDHVVVAEDGYNDCIPEEVPHTYVLNYTRFAPATRSCKVSLAEIQKTEVSRELRLLYTGVASRTRGLDTMLETIRILRTENIKAHLQISGICNIREDRRYAEAFVINYNLEDAVRFNGWKEYLAIRRMASSYENSDVGLCLMEPHANYMKSIPTKFYEYLAYGLPILCSDFPLWRKFVEKHKCGAVVPAGDAQAAAKVLRRWQRNPHSYERYAHAARRAAPQFQWERMGDRLVALYDQITER